MNETSAVEPKYVARHQAAPEDFQDFKPSPTEARFTGASLEAVLNAYRDNGSLVDQFLTRVRGEGEKLSSMLDMVVLTNLEIKAGKPFDRHPQDLLFVACAVASDNSEQNYRLYNGLRHIYGEWCHQQSDLHAQIFPRERGAAGSSLLGILAEVADVKLVSQPAEPFPEPAIPFPPPAEKEPLVIDPQEITNIETARLHVAAILERMQDEGVEIPENVEERQPVLEQLLRRALIAMIWENGQIQASNSNFETALGQELNRTTAEILKKQETNDAVFSLGIIFAISGIFSFARNTRGGIINERMLKEQISEATVFILQAAEQALELTPTEPEEPPKPPQMSLVILLEEDAPDKDKKLADWSAREYVREVLSQIQRETPGLTKAGFLKQVVHRGLIAILWQDARFPTHEPGGPNLDYLTFAIADLLVERKDETNKALLAHSDVNSLMGDVYPDGRFINSPLGRDISEKVVLNACLLVLRAAERELAEPIIVFSVIDREMATRTIKSLWESKPLKTETDLRALLKFSLLGLLKSGDASLFWDRCQDVIDQLVDASSPDSELPVDPASWLSEDLLADVVFSDPATLSANDLCTAMIVVTQVGRNMMSAEVRPAEKSPFKLPDVVFPMDYVWVEQIIHHLTEGVPPANNEALTGFLEAALSGIVEIEGERMKTYEVRRCAEALVAVSRPGKEKDFEIPEAQWGDFEVTDKLALRDSFSGGTRAIWTMMRAITIALRKRMMQVGTDKVRKKADELF
ncbi:hypothetical protein KKD62_03830 [Patescibacteria group bacterium]|nr:hypothetical protein [Patescibacteria group bacterium]MBU1931136.1 hypothetical protein [Patescibacteria group bacterium]